MPAAHGNDRVRELGEGGWAVFSTHPKPWVPRREKTQTHTEHPGTAVRWADELWEVTGVVETDAGLEYTLVPWGERHAVRATASYDDLSEEAAGGGRRDAAVRTAAYRVALLLAPLSGLLPAPEQERLERETGVSAVFLTVASAIPLMVFGGYCLLMLLAGGIGAAHGAAPETLPTPVLLIGMFLLIEAFFRFGIALSQGRPVGSVVGLLPFLFRRRPAAPAMPEPDEGRAVADAYAMREPYLALLTPAEQERLRERFGFDPIRWGRRSAWLLLIFCLLLGGTALSHLSGPNAFVGDVGVLLAAGTLVVEQVHRLRRLAARLPAGSVLAPIVRAFSRGVLAAS